MQVQLSSQHTGSIVTPRGRFSSVSQPFLMNSGNTPIFTLIAFVKNEP